MDTAITPVDPAARVMAYADDGMVLHDERSVLEPGQHRFMTWRAAIGRTLHVTTTHIRHPWEGDQPGRALRGFHLRP
jgi:hypothetical protein